MCRVVISMKVYLCTWIYLFCELVVEPQRTRENKVNLCRTADHNNSHQQCPYRPVTIYVIYNIYMYNIHYNLIKVFIISILVFLRYLNHVRSATQQDLAGGYTSGLACHRAIQDAFSSLFISWSHPATSYTIVMRIRAFWTSVYHLFTQNDQFVMLPSRSLWR